MPSRPRSTATPAPAPHRPPQVCQFAPAISALLLAALPRRTFSLAPCLLPVLWPIAKSSETALRAAQAGSRSSRAPVHTNWGLGTAQLTHANELGARMLLKSKRKACSCEHLPSRSSYQGCQSLLTVRGSP